MTDWLPSDLPPLFGVDRSETAVRFNRPAPSPPWRTRLYRAWRALLGDFG